MPDHPIVAVDPDLCVGSGECARVAPEAFVVGDDGFAVVLDGASRTPVSALQIAVRECPTGAISLSADASDA